MMGIIRILIVGLLAYLIYRLLKGAWRDDKPKVKGGRSVSKPDPLEGADIEDVNYTELPPEEPSDGNSSAKGD